MNGLIETFLMIFKGQTDPLEDAIDRSRKSADELREKLTEVDAAATETGSSMLDTVKSFAGWAAATYGLHSIITGANEAAQEIIDVGKAAEAAGTSIEDLDAFSAVIVKMGGEAQDARDAVADLAESLGEAMADKESGKAKTFQSLGIAVTDAKGQARDAVSVFGDLADAVGKMDHNQAIFRLREIGMTDNRVMEAIFKGRTEIERPMAARKEDSQVTKENYEIAQRYMDVQNALSSALDNLSKRFSLMLLPAMEAIIPAMQWVVEQFQAGTDWAEKNKDFIADVFIILAGVITTIYLPAVIRAGLATLIAFGPAIAVFAALAAVVAVVALAWDDFETYLEGGNSLIGVLLEKFPLLNTVLVNLIEMAKAAGVAIVDAFNYMADMVVAAWMSIESKVKPIIDWLKEAFSSIGSLLGKVGGWIGKGLDSIGLTADVGTKTVKEAINGPDDDFTKGWDNKKLRQLPTAGALMAGNQSTTKNNNLQVGQITVNTQATDAKAIANDIGNGLGNSLQSMDNNNSSARER